MLEYFTIALMLAAILLGLYCLVTMISFIDDLTFKATGFKCVGCANVSPTAHTHSGRVLGMKSAGWEQFPGPYNIPMGDWICPSCTAEAKQCKVCSRIRAARLAGRELRISAKAKCNHRFSN